MSSRRSEALPWSLVPLAKFHLGVLAGPLVSRVAALIAQMTRTFVPTTVEREMPRGTVDWNCYAGRALPTGRWTSFQCSYSELSSDPELVAALRWTLRRVGQDLEPAADFLVARRLMERIGDLLRALGPGPARRPGLDGLVAPSVAPEWLRLAVEAMAWVRDERGLGGARSLDGLPWSLPVNSVWEAWVEAFLHSLALRLGGRLSTGAAGFHQQAVCVAKTQPHPWATWLRNSRTAWAGCLDRCQVQGSPSSTAVQDWSGLPVALRESHRADLHQALAYAMFAEAPRVDTFLVYPGTVGPAGEPVVPEPVFALADLVAGGRQVRLGLGSIPFGFQGPAHRGASGCRVGEVLRDAA